MIVKPEGQEAESCWVALAERASAGRDAVRDAAEAGGLTLRKAANWYLVVMLGFGFFGALLSQGFPGIVAAGLIGFAIWKWRNR